MLIELSIAASCAIIGVGIGVFVSKKIQSNKSNDIISNASARAKAIESESEKILAESRIKLKDAELEAKKKYEEKTQKLEIKDQELNEFLKEERRLLKEEKVEIKNRAKKIESSQKNLEVLKDNYNDKLIETTKVLERSAGLTADEAKTLVIAQAKNDARADIANIVRKYETIAKQDAKKKANWILAQATTRFAGEFAGERLINVVSIPSDDLKGRIIGKEGRNIKALEMLLGVDIIIDDTPGSIIVSSFNLYRRAIAVDVIKSLVEDGRIQPARIEELYKKISSEFEEKLLEEGENILIDLGVTGVHPEIVKLIGRLRFRASYGQNALAHSLEVANLASIIAAECGGDPILARRAGILHDIGKALTHEMAGSHVDLGAEICNRYNEHEAVINCIYAHHGIREATSIESFAVCSADVLSAARPGARQEVLESFLKRVEEIEDISTSKTGVIKAYAINAGREVRILVNADLVNDNESNLIAKEIAAEIQEKVQYPGEVKVTVIRERRSVNYAR
ncbi:MAG: FIG002344: Hydrolase (HAD superfamily) [uncultured Campylobacterales bacterium]|uniref:Ribonuclease Y n=1 Tax=uncultured Campylobacterales bacterium TaxID=352960 RepID=A0A6S6SDW1_9BACT|nr:MAG: FIG002344: Hydrolase (HAD superfamily) [uncultured Campylobacterales bacterium]